MDDDAPEEVSSTAELGQRVWPRWLVHWPYAHCSDGCRHFGFRRMNDPGLVTFVALGVVGGLVLVGAFLMIRARDRRHPPVEVGTRHVTPADGNVFLDLGFPPDEAARLKARSDALIRAELAKKVV